MPAQTRPTQEHSSQDRRAGSPVSAILSAFSRWFGRHLDAPAHRRLPNLPPERLQQIADDIGVSTDDLATILADSPSLTREMRQVLLAAGVDPALLGAEPAAPRTM